MMKKVPCKQCNGYGFIGYCNDEDHGGGIGCYSCNECNGTGKTMVQETVADRIREMSDEAIATVLLDWFCIGNRECYTRSRKEVHNEILQWLHSSILM